MSVSRYLAFRHDKRLTSLHIHSSGPCVGMRAHAANRARKTELRLAARPGLLPDAS